jgi:hypothetical protein
MDVARETDTAQCRFLRQPLGDALAIPSVRGQVHIAQLNQESGAGQLGAGGSLKVERRDRTLTEKPMTYYFAKTLDLSFEDAVARTREALAEEGIGVTTETARPRVRPTAVQLGLS